MFAALVEAVHSLGQISHALYDAGGEYRRDMQGRRTENPAQAGFFLCMGRRVQRGRA
ncbi:hypothetical protein [Pseudoxanthomonas sp. PXM02]|uniref:hypothetical protein n=1 Tax=Pseudoxanthomonas sp. PXM02 TaxID=2769294 RepID=UPI00177DE2E7|nr:hypothetical protein [Pseudoxanthomonas sp. PXM02]MBD9477692.1 hypothetical protein [Pseudoxanthomonas sp. PXM02]